MSAPSLLIKALVEKCLDHLMFPLLHRVKHIEKKLTRLKVVYFILRGKCFPRTYIIYVCTLLASRLLNRKVRRIFLTQHC